MVLERNTGRPLVCGCESRDDSRTFFFLSYGKSSRIVQKLGWHAYFCGAMWKKLTQICLGGGDGDCRGEEGGGVTY